MPFNALSSCYRFSVHLVASRLPVLSATIHPDIKRTLVAMSERTGMTVSQVTDEVLYSGLIDLQELDGPKV